MENTITPALSVENTQCRACQVNVTADDAFCNNCGYPLKGTEVEQNNFMTQLTVNEIDLADYHEKIKQAGYRLYFVAFAFAVWSVIDGYATRNESSMVTVIIIDLIICGVFVFLGTWSRKKPFAALVSGISLYGIIVLLNMVVDPLSLLRGIIAKVIIIGSLISGIKAAMAAEKIKKETHLS